MRIANTLRKEAMPEMVYVMCKLARYKEYHKAGVNQPCNTGKPA